MPHIVFIDNGPRCFLMDELNLFVLITLNLSLSVIELMVAAERDGIFFFTCPQIEQFIQIS